VNPWKGKLTKERFDAVLFDLDGVLTDTASAHAECWKAMFDVFLRERAESEGQQFRPFDIETDYKQYVDGKPRFDGVRDFLKSRGIGLPEGSPDAPPDEQSVCGLGNRKSNMINEKMARDGVEAYPGSVALVKHLRSQGLQTAVVSSSANCRTVLEAASIADLFDARIDGKTAVERNLRGKPAPDTYLEGARVLGVEPERVVVVEDAISGVQSGRAGGFGLVVGVARKGDAADLTDNGANLAVADLSELLP
jgi:beta-phosphoglucomutase family hydrolase